jgi:hypothetical protein
LASPSLLPERQARWRQEEWSAPPSLLPERQARWRQEEWSAPPSLLPERQALWRQVWSRQAWSLARQYLP